MRKKKRVKRVPTRDQISVWLSTVLTPMRNSLTVELHYVVRGTWSFRCDSQDFEYLYPIPRMIAAPYRANLEQVFRYYHSLKAQATAHDRELTGLRKACQTAYHSLINSPRFQALPVPDEPARSDSRKYLAEYVINRYDDLPSHYAFSEFWKERGEEYLKLRVDPTLSARFTAIDTQGASFRRVLVALSTSVSKLQERLADDAGLAPSNPPMP